jgi:hypothetical protein
MPDDAGQAGARCARFLQGFLEAVARGPQAGPLLSKCVRRRALKHKFSVGSTVYFTASNVARPAASGTYEVVRLLPTDGDDCQYRIKSSTEAFERVAKESQLALS